MLPHLVHRMVQYSEPAFPAMTRNIARGALHSRHLHCTLADGNGIGRLSRLDMMQARFQISSRRRLFAARQLGGRVSIEIEAVDLSLRVGDRGLGIRPCEADFQC